MPGSRNKFGTGSTRHDVGGALRGGAPRRGGRGRLALDPSTPLRSAQDDTGQGFAEGEASPFG